ncbi:MAG TPA: phosphoribosyltransferase family protein [Myxococcaceae bacterium]|jgi:ComF family protein
MARRMLTAPPGRASVLGELLSGLIDVLWPALCAGCSRVVGRAAPFCGECQGMLTPLPERRCRRCAEPGAFPEDVCPRCRDRPPPFEGVCAPFIHEGPVAAAVHRFKYEDRPELADPLGRLIAASVPEGVRGRVTAVAAIPLHRARFRSRQYDQAQLLARKVASALKVPFEPRALQRVRDTARQVGETLAAREANVRGAFVGHGWMKGERVLLVDDVVTTGATARAAAQALLLAGAHRVELAAVARAFSAEGAVQSARPFAGSG